MTPRKFSGLRDALYEANPESKANVADKVAKLREELALADLRAHRSRTQAQLASAIGTTQSAISRLERQPDLLVSTLNDYVAGTGGQLRLIADFGNYEVELDLPAARPPVVEAPERLFRVIWQNLQTRRLVHVGWLRAAPGAFAFEYTPEAELDRDFEPFLYFPDLRDRYQAAELFPFFAERIPLMAEPGFEAVVEALGLDAASVTPVELLARSWGRSPHDTIQVIPEPDVNEDGTSTRLFLVSGVSHVDEDNPEAVSKLIARLKPGQRLAAVPELDNPVNADAIMVEDHGNRLGWIPDYLLPDVLKAGQERIQVTVERANGPTVPWHLRLLCRLEVGPVSAHL